MRAWVIVAVLLNTIACEAGIEPNTADLSGRWTFTELLEDRIHGFSCADTGTYEIEQTGDRFTGTYIQRGVCRTPEGTVSNPDAGTLDQGRVIGRTLRFTVTSNCDYEGIASGANGAPPTLLTGRGFCVLTDAGRTLTFSGDWRATRN